MPELALSLKEFLPSASSRRDGAGAPPAGEGEGRNTDGDSPYYDRVGVASQTVTARPG